MHRLWTFIAAAFGLLAAALLFVAGQRNRAREALARTRAEARGREAVIEAERAIDHARALAREKAQEVQREADERPDDQRPTGPLRR